jgi:CheY-like chemotaxis protein
VAESRRAGTSRPVAVSARHGKSAHYWRSATKARRGAPVDPRKIAWIARYRFVTWRALQRTYNEIAVLLRYPGYLALEYAWKMSSQTTILTIEDDSAIRRGITDALLFHGYRVSDAADGHSGLELALTSEYDLMLLDLALPGVHGFEILRQVRRQRPTQPIIILTAKGDESDRVLGLKTGADDYVVKPFSIKELLARVEAVLRRTAERPVDLPEVAVPGGIADFRRRELRFDDQQRVELSEK